MARLRHIPGATDWVLNSVNSSGRPYPPPLFSSLTEEGCSPSPLLLSKGGWGESFSLMLVEGRREREGPGTQGPHLRIVTETMPGQCADRVSSDKHFLRLSRGGANGVAAHGGASQRLPLCAWPHFESWLSAVPL